MADSAEKNIGQICQSCAMPMKAEEDFGTNSDGSKNSEYTRFCYQNVGFKEPDLKLEDQIERLVEMAETKMDMPEELARETANKVLPKLKRWKR